MQINKTQLIKRFESFINSVSNTSENNKLLSFSFKIPSLNISFLINSNLLTNKNYFYWKIKNERQEFLAIDSLVNIQQYGEQRLKDTGDRINSIARNFLTNWNENEISNFPMVVGGIKFSPNQNSELWTDYGDSDWFIPKQLFYKKDDYTYLIYNIFSGNSERQIDDFADFITSLNEVYSNPNPIFSESYHSEYYTDGYENWEKIVNKALENISAGLLSKVVLSRKVKLALDKMPLISELLERLSINYPNCYTFAYRKNSSIFFGASPEKLAKISDRWLEIDALAGSAPRGKNENEDFEFETSLLKSKKNLFEQRAVVNFINNLLSKFSDEIVFDDKPIVRKLPNIQHLWTIIRARVHDNFKMFDLLTRLHPTPAICGDPWKIAQNFILEMEPYDRGLYSGNIGWFNFNGSGEFAVSIRSALMQDTDLYAFAGCGIVEGSEPKAEYEESEIKLKPILSLFVNEKVYQS